MPLFLDIHNFDTDLPPLKDIYEIHKIDLLEAMKYEAEIPKYYINYESKKAFCVIEANSKEEATKIHNQTMLADNIIEVEPVMLDMFLGGGGVNQYDAATMKSDKGEEQLDTGYRIILFTDLVGSTEMTHRLGDEEAMNLLRKHNSIIRNQLMSYNGREVKHTGDGIMASFFNADMALDFAVRLQEEFYNFNKSNSSYDELEIKIGFHCGHPVEENNDLFGTPVQVASRVCDHAKPKQVLLTEETKSHCNEKKHPMNHIGDADFKGVNKLVSLYEVSNNL